MTRFIITIWLFIVAVGVGASASAQPAESGAAKDPVVKESSAREGDEADPSSERDEVFVWTVTGDESGAFRDGLKAAIAGDSARHLFGRDDVEERLAEANPTDALACFKGVEPCLSARSVAMDAIGASTLIRVELGDGGARYELVDRRGQVIRSDTADGASPRDLAFSIVRAVFDATATVAFESEPEGATVSIDGVVIGTTPFARRMPIGSYSYRMNLTDHAEVRSQVTVGSGETPVVRHELTVLPGMVVVTDGPANAEVYLNDRKVGVIEQPIEVEPGTYALEVRAEGYQPIRDAVTVTPGGTVTRSAPMNQQNLFSLDLTAEQIIVNNYILRVGYEAGFQSTTLLDARTDEDLPLEFAGFTEDGSLPSDVILRETLQTNNLRVDASYAFRNFGIVLASLTYGGGSVDLPGLLQARDGTTIQANVTSFRKLHLRPFQLFWRAIYDNWVPSVEVGTGFVFNWYDVERLDTGELETLRRTDAMWTFAIAAQYYVTPNVFGMLRYSLQGYFDDAVGADHMISLSVGAAFPNIFGFEPEPPDTLESE